jgi:hypothetical protein
MKKAIMMCMLLVFSITMGLTSCDPKKNKQEQKVNTFDALVVENTISTDKEYVFINYANDYRWYETCVLMKDFLDADCQDGTIEGVSNIFYVVEIFESGGDAYAIMCTHSDNGKDSIAVAHGLWIEDQDMSKESITITFRQAYEKMMQANYKKPHSRHCVLRKQVGPVQANAQYIFGNLKEQIYVDAVTGEVTDENPAFKGFNEPLKE